MPTKTCRKCGIEKAISEFYKQPLGTFGVMAVCKLCQKSPSARRKFLVPEGFKLCSKCDEVKPLLDFSKHSSCRFGHRSICKDCCGKDNVVYRENNPEVEKNYYKQNKEKIIQNSKKNYDIYREECPWKLTLRQIKSRCNNPNNRDYKWYGGCGIKCLITEDELKELWFRDRAYELQIPSIDRIDNYGNYEFGNCEYIERIDNLIKSNFERKLLLFK